MSHSKSSSSSSYAQKGTAASSASAVIANKALKTLTQLQEAALDAELDQYDALLQDDDALERLRERRKLEWKEQQQQRQRWKEYGHGTYSELTGDSTSDVAKAFFEASKQSDRFIVHFYRPTTSPYCDVFHKHLTTLAENHWETRFVKINVESTREGNQGLQYLIDKLQIRIMPTVVLIHKRRQVHQLRGFDELGGHENFSTTLLAHVLAAYEVLTLKSHEMDQLDEASDELEQIDGGVNRIKLNKAIRRGIYEGDDNDEEVS
jgi:hypothetical protein